MFLLPPSGSFVHICLAVLIVIYYVLSEGKERGAVWYPRSTSFAQAGTFECMSDNLWEIASADRRRVLRIDAPLNIALRTFLRRAFPGEQIILRHVPTEEVPAFRELHMEVS